MADGSHLGFIQKPVTFKPFEITMSRYPDSVQPRIQPDFKIFSFLEIQDGGCSPCWLYSEACNF